MSSTSDETAPVTATTLTDLPPLPAPMPAASESNPKRALWGIIGGALAGALVGIAIVKLGVAALPKLSLGPLQKLVLAACVVLAPMLVVLVHELGHVAGGWLAGFEFSMLIWGPFKVWREDGRLRVGRNRSWSLAGGMALSVPRDTNTHNGHAALMVAGGPVSSLLLAAGLFACYDSLALGRFGDGVPRAIAAATLLSAAATSLAIGLVTLVPMRTSGFLTDGARLLRLAQGGGTAVHDRAMMTLVGLASSSTRPRDWPASLLRDVDSHRDGSPMDALGPFMAYLHALDIGSTGEAHAYLSRVVERMTTVPPAARGSFGVEFAFHELVVRGDPVRASSWLAIGQGSAIEDRLLRPLVEQVLQARAGEMGARERVMGLLPAVERRSGVDRMRAELVRGAMDAPRDRNGV